MQGKQPDPRWTNFIQQYDSKGVAIGFKLEENGFFYVYDEQGGWVDQKGKYFDAAGVLIDEEFEVQYNDDDDSQIDDDEIVDEFEQMLMEEEQGIMKSKPKNDKTEPKSIPTQISEDQKSKNLIQRLIKKEELRQGLSSNVWIFFKMKSNLYQRIQYEVENKQDLISRNALIKEIKAKADIKRTELLAVNKWLQGDFFLDYSGVSLEQGVYDRYWYGWIKVAPQNYFSTIQQIKKSNQFSILQSKTLYALKSKFFLKEKMKQTISKLKESLKDVAEDGAVLVKFNNLPQEFPLSLILDLIQLSGGYLEDVEDIDIVDNFSADMIVKRRTAELLTNIEGYAHGEKEFIWLQIEPENRPIKFNKFINIEIDAQYKPLFRETGDVLGLEWSSQEIAKSYDKGQKFRFAINQGVLRKILMFRGESLNVVRIVRFEKKD